MVAACQHALFRSKSKEKLFAEICKIAVGTGGYLMAWVGLALQDKAKTIVVAGSAGNGSGYLEKLHLSWADVEQGRGPTGTAIRTGTTQINQDIWTSPSMQFWRQPALEHGYQSCAALPLLDGKKPLGALVIYSEQPYAFNPSEISLLETLANDITYGMLAMEHRAQQEQLLVALRESEEKHRQLFESSRDALMMLAPPSWKFTGANQATLKLFGANNVEQFISLGPWNLSPERQSDGSLSNDKASEMVSIAMREGSHFFEWTHQRLDGQVFEADVLLTRMQVGEDTFLQATVRDITHHKKAEAEIFQLKERYQHLFNNSPDAYLLFSLDEGVFIDCNHAAETMLRGTREQIIGISPDSLSPEFQPDGRSSLESVPEKISAVFEKGRHIFEWVHRRFDGEDFWAEVSISFTRLGNQKVLFTAWRDISDRKSAEKTMRIASVVFDTHEAIMITDARANIIKVNQAFQDITGYSAEEVLGKNPRILNSGRQDRAFYEAMWQDLLNKGSWTGEVWDKRKNGQIYPKWLTITAVKDNAGITTEYVAIFSDITARKKAEEQIYSLAYYDTLTKLPNRRFLLDRLRQAQSVSARSKHYGALMFLDMDRFKTLNDTLGHDVGDLFLIEIAIRLQKCVREVDTIARIGGDEFVVLIEEISPISEESYQKVALIAEKIRASLSAPYQLKGHEHHSSPSIGVTLYLGHDEVLESILKQADMAMYQTKEAGGNAFRFFDPVMQIAVETRATLEADLRHALPDKQLHLFYQIQLTSELTPLGAEALIRWNHPVRGWVAPMQFIPIAEESSLIIDIGRWVLETACKQLARWSRSEQTKSLILAVNVSAQQFKRHDFVDEIMTLVNTHQINPHLLKLELTESVILNDVADVTTKMHALKAIGIKLSLDDFGTGYSSLSYLKQLPLDQIKIDQGFVRNIMIDTNDAVMVQTIIGLAKNFQMNVVAEGVETEAQLNFLRENSCPGYQGYLFGKPAPIEEFEAALQRYV